MIRFNIGLFVLVFVSTLNAYAEESARIKVGQARRDQSNLIQTPEHCGVSTAVLKAKHWSPGQQIRLKHESLYALYTIVEMPDESPADGPEIRMGKAARTRLGAPDSFLAAAEPFVPHPTFSEREARAQGEFIERVEDNGSQNFLLILAPHGGDIERHTDTQAARVRERIGASRSSTWICRGYRLPAGKGQPSAAARWHITSADFSERSFPGLSQIAKRSFQHTVSFHGMAGEGLLIGGGAPLVIREQLANDLRRVVPAGTSVRVAGKNDSLSGASKQNIVNRYCPSGGIQIEQGSAVRRDHGEAIADAVARFFESKAKP